MACSAFITALPATFTSPNLFNSHRHVRACAAPTPIAFVLSHFEASDLLALQPTARAQPTIIPGPFSVDLGATSLPHIAVQHDGISTHPSEPPVATWRELAKMSKKGRSGAYECYTDGETVPQKIAAISDITQRTASLYPCARNKPPTLLLGGFGMHRIKNSDPAADTRAKIQAVGEQRLRGHVLDVCTGLGYTAIAAAQHDAVSKVTTIELDPMVVAIQRRNPWSRSLFDHGKIERLVGDACDYLKQLEDDSFNVIIHDPPAQAMAGELYSGEFYKQLRRVCARNAVLFHYIGDPASRESGRLFRGVAKRLAEERFSAIKTNALAYGLTAIAT